MCIVDNSTFNMGSSASKGHSNKSGSIHTKSPASSRNSTLTKKRKRWGSNTSLTSDVSFTNGVSLIPNGTAVSEMNNNSKKCNGDVNPTLQLNGEVLRNGSEKDNAQKKSLPDISDVNLSIMPDGKHENGSLKSANGKNEKRSRKTKSNHSRNSSIDSKQISPSGPVTDQQSDPPVKEQAKDPQTPDPDEIKTHPGTGDEYNGGGTLLKKGTGQDLLSRVLKKKTTLQLLWDTNRDGSKKKLSKLCDVSFLSQDYVAISCSDSAKAGVQLYSIQDEGRPAQRLGAQFLKAPRGICCGNDNSIAVTDWDAKTVQFMSMDGDFLGCWKTNKFKHPGGIAINRDGRYVIADITRKEAAIGLYSPYGKVLRRFGQETFDWPWYVTVDRQNRILVSEQKTNVIAVFDDVGRFLFKFGGLPANGSLGKSSRSEDQFNAPGGLAVDSQNNILVADTDNYRVNMFSPDGLFIKTVVTTTFSRPVSVAYDDGLVAVVTDSDLRVFKTYLEKTSF